jgi:hypothetical protein
VMPAFVGLGSALGGESRMAAVRGHWISSRGEP